jgi:hypothetical protein
VEVPSSRALDDANVQLSQPTSLLRFLLCVFETGRGANIENLPSIELLASPDTKAPAGSPGLLLCRDEVLRKKAGHRRMSSLNRSYWRQKHKEESDSSMPLFGRSIAR